MIEDSVFVNENLNILDNNIGVFLVENYNKRENNFIF